MRYPLCHIPNVYSSTCVGNQISTRAGATLRSANQWWDIAALRSGSRSALPAIAFASHVPETARQRDQATLERIGVRPVVIADSPGLAVTRTVSMLINGATDAARDLA